MQISAIQSIAPTGFTSLSSIPSNSTTSTTAAKQPAAPSSSSSSVAAPTTAPATKSTTPAPAASSSHAPAPSQSNSTSSAEAASLAAVYSTTVGGKTYSADIEESGGVYTASVPNLPGASSSGSSLEAAENGIGTIISILA